MGNIINTVSWPRCLILASVLLLPACFGERGCFGDGGTSGVAGSTSDDGTDGTSNSNPYALVSDTDKLSPSTGKLIPQKRSNGLSSRYTSDTDYRLLVDELINLMIEVINEEANLIKWPQDIPTVFTGCGEKNAWFGGNFNVHLHLTSRGVLNPSETFGENIIGASLVMCHELTEAAVQYFTSQEVSEQLELLNEYGLDPTEIITRGLAVWLLQVMFHEVGHGLDQMILRDSENTIKRSFDVPLANICGAGADCNTIREDFADWIAAFALTDAINDEISTGEDPADPEKRAAIWFISVLLALDAWENILGQGGGTVHSRTDIRALNLLCYTFGGSDQIRDLDAQAGGLIATALSNKGITLPNQCQTTYTKNEELTEQQLSEFIAINTAGGDGGTGSDTGDGKSAETAFVIQVPALVGGDMVRQDFVNGDGNGTGSPYAPTGAKSLVYYRLTSSESAAVSFSLSWSGGADLDLVKGQPLVCDVALGCTDSSMPEQLPAFEVCPGRDVIIAVAGWNTFGQDTPYTLTGQRMPGSNQQCLL